jgi:CRISPR/Cas system CSM-associated protein Csm2 small subunit
VEESVEKLQSFIEGKQFLLFEITCYHVDDDKEEDEKEKDEREVDTKLPLLKVSVSAATGRDAARAATDGTAVSSHIKGVFMKLKRFAGWSIHLR